MVTRKTRRIALDAMVTEKEYGVKKHAPMSFMRVEYSIFVEDFQGYHV
jgi:hypothetical protein